MRKAAGELGKQVLAPLLQCASSEGRNAGYVAVFVAYNEQEYSVTGFSGGGLLKTMRYVGKQHIVSSGGIALRLCCRYGMHIQIQRHHSGIR